MMAMAQVRDVQEECMRYADGVLEKIPAAEIISSSPTPSGDSIQCRIRFSTFTIRFTQFHKTLRHFQNAPIQVSTSLFSQQVKDLAGKLLYTPDFSKTLNIQLSRGPIKYPNHQDLDQTLLMNHFLKTGNGAIERLLEAVWQDMRKVVLAGKHDKQKQSDKLKKARDYVFNALVYAEQAGLSDDAVRSIWNQAKTKVTISE